MTNYQGFQNNLWHDFMTSLLKLSRAALERFLELVLDVGMAADRWIRKINSLLVERHPSFAQYANRLIEFIDIRHINEAYNRFEQLVMAGIAPDHAFRLVIEP